MNYYLVTHDNLAFHLIKTERDLSEDEINEIMKEKYYKDAPEMPVYWVRSMWWGDGKNGVIEV